ncbi:MAG: GNAT family N-acetyltransferase [Bacteroidales bacterium]|nr:GNAT family N-acetyltransferase [Bacteroidales bacterium]
MIIKEITQASKEYLILIQSLLDQLTSASRPFSEADLQKIAESENSHLFLLFDGERVAGMLTTATYKSPTGSKAWIEDVVIDKKYRGKGLGRLLMEHAITYCKSSDIDSLMLTSGPQRKEANKLYQSLGFEQKITNVYKMKL